MRGRHRLEVDSDVIAAVAWWAAIAAGFGLLGASVSHEIADRPPSTGAALSVPESIPTSNKAMDPSGPGPHEPPDRPAFRRMP